MLRKHANRGFDSLLIHHFYLFYWGIGTAATALAWHASTLETQGCESPILHHRVRLKSVHLVNINMKQKVFDKTCPYCHKEFRQIKGRVFSNHVRWCEENPRHNEICGKKLRSKINATLKQKKINLHGVLKKFTVKCEKCGNEF